MKKMLLAPAILIPIILLCLAAISAHSMEGRGIYSKLENDAISSLMLLGDDDAPNNVPITSVVANINKDSILGEKEKIAFSSSLGLFNDRKFKASIEGFNDVIKSEYDDPILKARAKFFISVINYKTAIDLLILSLPSLDYEAAVTGLSYAMENEYLSPVHRAYARYYRAMLYYYGNHTYETSHEEAFDEFNSVYLDARALLELRSSAKTWMDKIKPEPAPKCVYSKRKRDSVARRPKQYSDSVRQAIVQRIESGEITNTEANELSGVARSTLYHWVAESKNGRDLGNGKRKVDFIDNSKPPKKRKEGTPYFLGS